MIIWPFAMFRGLFASRLCHGIAESNPPPLPQRDASSAQFLFLALFTLPPIFFCAFGQNGVLGDDGAPAHGGVPGENPGPLTAHPRPLKSLRAARSLNEPLWRSLKHLRQLLRNGL